ncbi:MAG: hypothetical protein IPJ89_03920 [Candidatus Iainarchaeum archaeon]|uniref:DUF2892 domain-containing protein n=1 Tax=Candidatus Iainarchaeum sp. TaxID=3101447 RepID=A0A7T9DJ73_9ARCH|nr:MAG: hypothetical protein IPJ89_03920 [Candidatus Diapherotrites archaeon]
MEQRRHTQNICNIGSAGQKRRRMIGIFLLAFAGMLSGFLIALHFETWQRLIVFPFFVAGFVALLESQQKVCIINAYTGKVEE